MIDWQVAPAGISGAFCVDCGTNFPNGYVRAIAGSSSPVCLNCSAPITGTSTIVDSVLYEDEPVLRDADAVFQRVWWHATTVEDWGTKVLTDEDSHLLVHLGSYDAAVDRAIHCDMRNPGQAWMLYAVTLREDAAVSPYVQEDNDTLSPKNDDDYDAELDGWELEGITRYVNSCEAPGSISLVVNPRSSIKQAKGVNLDPVAELEARQGLSANK